MTHTLFATRSLQLGLVLALSLFLVGFTFRISDDMGLLDWGNGEIQPLIVQQLMEGLTTSGANGKAEPALAQSWASVAGGRAFRFTIRTGAKWSDGKQVCAQQFVDAWLRVLSPEFGSPYAHYLFDIEGARDFHAGREKNRSLVGVKASGCGTLEVKLERPAAYFPVLASHWVLLPIRADLIAKFERRWTEPGKLAVTGPYTLASWSRDKEITLRANPYYWGRKPLTALRAVVVSDDSTAIGLFRAHEIDWMRDIPFLDKAALASTPEYSVTSTFIGYHLGFRFGDGEALDRPARCALAAAIDRAQIPEILKGGETPADRLVPSGLTINEPPTAPRFNVEKARELWKSSRFSGRALEFHYYAKDVHEPLAQWLQQQWKTNLGAEVRLVKAEGKTYWAGLEQAPPSIFLSGITAAYAHPYAFLSEFLTGSGGNWGHYSSPKYDALARMAASETAGQTSGASVAAQQLLLAEECAVIPLYFRKTASLSATGWSGILNSPMGATYFKGLKRRSPGP